MNELQLELTRLLWKKELSFGCLVKIDKNIHKLCFYIYRDREWITKLSYENNDSLSNDHWRLITEIVNNNTIIWHPATLSDFHRWLEENKIRWDMWYTLWFIGISLKNKVILIDWNSSKDLLDQDSEVLKQIIELIKNNYLRMNQRRQRNL